MVAESTNACLLLQPVLNGFVSTGIPVRLAGTRAVSMRLNKSKRTAMVVCVSR